MELLSLSAISLGLVAVGETLGGGVAGNYAHAWCKGAVRSIAQRAKAGELVPNHVLLRAARRSYLRATLFSVAQYRVRLHRQPEPQVRHLLHWCAMVETWLRGEVTATRDDSYGMGASPLNAREAALLVQRADDGELQDLRDAFANEVLEGLRSELQAWHETFVVPIRLLPDLPEDFMQMLADGWTFDEPAQRPIWHRVVSTLTRRRGPGAGMVRRMASRTADSGAAGARVTWFAAFAAHFAEELGTDARVQAAFTGKLLSNLVVSGTDSRPTADQFGAALATALQDLSGGLTSHIDRLREALDDGNTAVLSELAQARDAAERDRILMRQAADALGRIDERTKDIANDVAAVVARLARPAPPKPWQLPPRAIENSFAGRAETLHQLVERLRRVPPLTYVIGPAGFGKTALAAEALLQVVGIGGNAPANPFPDGVVFLDIYRLRPFSDAIWTALADALMGNEGAQSAPEARARHACAGRRLLVVFEGAELADGIDGAARMEDLRSVLSPENSSLVLTRDSAQSIAVQSIVLDQPLAPAEAAALFDRLAVPAPPDEVRQQVLTLLDGHPLALTWAASLLADPAEDARRLSADWQREALPPLNNPLRAEHTLAWLFERSTRGLDDDAAAALAAMGLLAHAPVPLAAIAAAVGVHPDAVTSASSPSVEARARASLKRLVQRSLLRRHDRLADAFQFTHALGYRFARAARVWPGPSGGAASGEALRRWLTEAQQRSLTTTAWAQGQGQVPTQLQHARALLESCDATAGWDLFVRLQYLTYQRLMDLGQLGLAAASLDAAAAWFKAGASETGSGNDRAVRERSVGLNRYGNVHALQGRLDEALLVYEESLTLARRLAQTDPSNTEWQRDVGVSLDNVGGIRQAQRRLDEALLVYEELLTLARRLAQTDPSNTEWQRDVGVSLDNIGRIRQAQGRLDEALLVYEEWLTLARRLAQTDPSNTEWQRDVGVSLNNVGGIRQAQGRLDEALLVYEESLTLARRLAQTDPSNTQWQRELSFVLTVLAEVLAELDRRPQACERARESLAIDERLAALSTGHAIWQSDVGVSQALVDRLCSSGAPPP
jgi:tetratricopeptide (TPR) repeat protein